MSATFDDMGGVGVDPKTVKLMIGGRNQTRNASITPQFLTWRGGLPAGTYPVEVTASHNAGNAVRQNWIFVVASAQAPAAALPLDITNYANNAQVPSGVIEVRGRTAPDTKLTFKCKRLLRWPGFLASTNKYPISPCGQTQRVTFRSASSRNSRFRVPAMNAPSPPAVAIRIGKCVWCCFSNAKFTNGALHK